MRNKNAYLMICASDKIKYARHNDQSVLCNEKCIAHNEICLSYIGKCESYNQLYTPKSTNKEQGITKSVHRIIRKA